MRHLYSLLFILLAGVLCSFSCTINLNLKRVQGDGNIISQEIPISDYNQLGIKAQNIKLVYTQSNEAPYLKIETDQNIMNVLEVKIDDEDKELIIRPKDKRIQITPTKFIITTNSTALKEFQVSGSGNCNLGKGLTGDKLEIESAGGWTIQADSITVNRLNYESAGSGKINLSGTANHVEIESAGACTVKAFGLQTNIFDCEIAGSGNIEITVNKEISAQVTGSGTILYKGNAQQIKKQVVGSGKISKVE